MSDAIIEVAARALQDSLGNTLLPILNQHVASIVLAAVTPLIRAEALEEAAKVIDDDEFYSERTPEEVAVAIRALKEQP
jgi:hypothetical protein